MFQEADPAQEWFAFLIDEASIEVFREARTVLSEQGFAVGWDPSKLKFPYTEVVLGGGGSSSYRPGLAREIQ